MTTDSFDPIKPKVTIHTFFTILTLIFLFALAFVFGISYFLDSSALHSRVVDHTWLWVGHVHCYMAFIG